MGPLEEQVLLTAQPSLQPTFPFLKASLKRAHTDFWQYATSLKLTAEGLPI